MSNENYSSLIVDVAIKLAVFDRRDPFHVPARNSKASKSGLTFYAGQPNWISYVEDAARAIEAVGCTLADWQQPSIMN